MSHLLEIVKFPVLHPVTLDIAIALAEIPYWLKTITLEILQHQAAQRISTLIIVVSGAYNQYIRMISEGSCDTENE